MHAFFLPRRRSATPTQAERPGASRRLARPARSPTRSWNSRYDTQAAPGRGGVRGHGPNAINMISATQVTDGQIQCAPRAPYDKNSQWDRAEVGSRQSASFHSGALFERHGGAGIDPGEVRIGDGRPPRVRRSASSSQRLRLHQDVYLPPGCGRGRRRPRGFNPWCARRHGGADCQGSQRGEQANRRVAGPQTVPRTRWHLTV